MRSAITAVLTFCAVLGIGGVILLAVGTWGVWRETARK